MAGLGIYLTVILAVVVAYPKGVGRWAAEVHKAYRAALSDEVTR